MSKIEQEAEKQSTEYTSYWPKSKLPETKNAFKNGFIEGAKFNNNDVISEAIKKVKQRTLMTSVLIKREIIEILEGLKIKP